MVLSVTSNGDNPFVPGVSAQDYRPDQLIAGDLKLVTHNGIITGGALLKRGTILGRVALGAVTSAAKAGGNTGTGTCVVDVATPLLANAGAGIYALRCIVAGANAATFRLYDPLGRTLKDFAFNGAGQSFTTDSHIKVAVTDAAIDFVVGDGFDITVAEGSGAWKKAVKTATDGSQVPLRVLVDDADATGGDVQGGLYSQGEFNETAIIYDGTFSLADMRTAFRQSNIHLKSVVSAADPS